MKRILSAIVLMVILFACSEDEPPVVTSISLERNELELKIGESYQFKVIHNPADAKAPTYEWQASKYYPIWGGGTGYDVVTIDYQGKATAIKEGTTYITVETTDILDPQTGKPFQQTCKVTIKPIEAESLKLDKSELTIDPGKSEFLNCSFLPENTTNKNVYWKSSDNSVVTVTTGNLMPLKGELKAVGAGEAIITVSLSNNSAIFATCKVKVNKAKLEAFSFEEKEKTVMQGEAFKLTPIFTPVYATNKNVTWSSSDDKIAIVDKSGNINTIHFGECVIKAVSEDGGLEANCKMVVKPIPVESIKFEKYTYQVEIGGTMQLSATIYPENAGNKKINWSSSNPVIAPIDENGIVRGNTRGYVTITATSEDGGHTAICDVSVVDINQMMNVYFPSSSVVIINGFYTGTIACAIKNNSSQTIRLTKFYVVDTNNYYTVAETTDPSLLGAELRPGQTVALSGRFNSVYEPAFSWEFEYNGRTFSTYNRYGTGLSSSELKSAGKANVQIPLRRSQY